MKLMQQDSKFSPIAVVLESEEEVEQFWHLIRLSAHNVNTDDDARSLAIRISNYLSNEAKL